MNDKTDFGFGSMSSELAKKGEDVMKAVGSLKEATKNLKDATGDCAENTEEVSDWLTIIGRALVSIFK